MHVYIKACGNNAATQMCVPTARCQPTSWGATVIFLATRLLHFFKSQIRFCLYIVLLCLTALSSAYSKQTRGTSSELLLASNHLLQLVAIRSVLAHSRRFQHIERWTAGLQQQQSAKNPQTSPTLIFIVGALCFLHQPVSIMKPQQHSSATPSPNNEGFVFGWLWWWVWSNAKLQGMRT